MVRLPGIKQTNNKKVLLSSGCWTFSFASGAKFLHSKSTGRDDLAVATDRQSHEDQEHSSPCAHSPHLWFTGQNCFNCEFKFDQIETGPWRRGRLLGSKLWPKSELRTKGEDRWAKTQGWVWSRWHWTQLSAQTGWDRRCFSEMITSSLHTDYDSNIKKDKDRARAFHTCKMKLAGHVSLPFTFR